MSTAAEDAAQATFEQRYRSMLEDNVRLVREKDELRDDLVNAARVIAELQVELEAVKQALSGIEDERVRFRDLWLKTVPAEQLQVLKVDPASILMPARPRLAVVPREPHDSDNFEFDK